MQEHFDDLVLATYGRGIWVLDDLTPLREIARGLTSRGPTLLPPRITYRFRTRGAPMAQPDVPATGTNPLYGALLHYWIPEPTGDGATPAEGDDRHAAIRIRDSEGDLVRTLDDLPAAPGLHRVTWDLRHDATTQVRLRTRPDERPDWEMPEQGFRPLPDGGRFSMLAAPGSYRIELVLAEDGDGGAEDGSEPNSTVDMEVLLDPDSTASPGDLVAQQALLVEIRDGIERAAYLINEAERLRHDLRQLEDRLSERVGDVEVFEATNQAGSLRQELRAIEGEFFDLRMTGTGQDSLRWPRRLYARLTYLARSVGQADARPTDQQAAVWEMLSSQLAEQEDRFGATLAGPLADLNRTLADSGFPLVDTR